LQAFPPHVATSKLTTFGRSVICFSASRVMTGLRASKLKTIGREVDCHLLSTTAWASICNLQQAFYKTLQNQERWFGGDGSRIVPYSFAFVFYSWCCSIFVSPITRSRALMGSVELLTPPKRISPFSDKNVLYVYATTLPCFALRSIFLSLRKPFHFLLSGLWLPSVSASIVKYPAYSCGTTGTIWKFDSQTTVAPLKMAPSFPAFLGHTK